jgi:hypothetical protein
LLNDHESRGEGVGQQQKQKTKNGVSINSKEVEGALKGSSFYEKKGTMGS